MRVHFLSKKLAICLILGVFGIAVISLCSNALAASDNFLDAITDQYANNAASWEIPLRQYGMQLFGLLALIDFVWMAARLILSRCDLGDWATEIFKQILFIGFFYALLTHSADWANAIVQSFKMAGNAASSSTGGSTGLGPSDILDAGVNIVTACLHAFRVSFDKMGESLVMALCGIIILISLALIAALEIVALVESYIFIYAGILFMGFGGSRFTNDYALRALNAVIAVGAKLFVIQLIIGLAQNMIHQWEAQVTAVGPGLNISDMLAMVGGSVVFLALAKMIPETVQGMINGASYSTGRPLISAGVAATHTAIAAGSAATAAVTGVLGGIAGLAGPNAASSTLGSWSAQSARSAGSHAGDAFRHASDVDPGRFNHYLPYQDRSESQTPLRPAFRNGEFGQDLEHNAPNPSRNGNTIGV